MESEAMLASRKKSPLPEKILPRGRWNPWRCIKQDSEPNTQPVSYSGPQGVLLFLEDFVRKCVTLAGIQQLQTYFFQTWCDDRHRETAWTLTLVWMILIIIQGHMCEKSKTLMNLSDFVEIGFAVDLDEILDTCESVSFKLGIVIDTTQLDIFRFWYQFEWPWHTVRVTESVTRKLQLVQPFCFKVGWSSTGVCNGWFKGNDYIEVLNVWQIWVIWTCALHVRLLWWPYNSHSLDGCLATSSQRQSICMQVFH